LFTNGVDIDIAQLYLQIQFPVSRGTSMISPILKWNHDDDHFVPYFDTFSHFGRRNLIINLSDKNFEFMKGHVVGNQVLFPAAGWIFYVWETFAMMIGEPFEKLSVQIDNFKFIRATPLIENRDIHVVIAIYRGEVFQPDTLNISTSSFVSRLWTV
jgi:fatty acid synthase, animal type